MSNYIVDIAIIVVLILFAWRGAKKGLILSLFSLLALFVAFYGAKYVSANFTGPVADILRPSIQLSINEMLEGETPAEGSAAAVTAPEDASQEDPPSAAGDFTLKQILRLLDKADLFPGLQEYLEEAIEEKTLEVTSTAAAAVTGYLARVAASALLFGLSFLVILLVWGLAGRALDLTFKLPILAAVNAIGGLLLGVIKGGVIILVLVWLARLASWITPENAGPVTELMTLDKISATLRELIAMAAAAAN